MNNCWKKEKLKKGKKRVQMSGDRLLVDVCIFFLVFSVVIVLVVALN